VKLHVNGKVCPPEGLPLIDPDALRARPPDEVDMTVLNETPADPLMEMSWHVCSVDVSQPPTLKLTEAFAG
jgi:hypothetical protein